MPILEQTWEQKYEALNREHQQLQKSLETLRNDALAALHERDDANKVLAALRESLAAMEKRQRQRARAYYGARVAPDGMLLARAEWECEVAARVGRLEIRLDALEAEFDGPLPVEKFKDLCRAIVERLKQGT